MLPLGFRDADPNRAVLGVERSASGRAWRDRLDAVAAAKAAAMVQRHDLPDVVARVMAARGVEVDEALAFLDPTLKRLMPDPSGLRDMDAAARRLADAVARRERVTLFGDYDVDGATSSALMARLLRQLGLEPTIYIPDRLTEGYGPNVEAIRQLAKAGTELLVLLDCGISSFEPLAEAAKLGLHAVVLDHHQVGVDLPRAQALVNPNRQDDLSGQGHLAAVGVTFLAAVALVRELRRRGWFRGGREPDLMELLDLVALGTVADVVPLKGLNRAFVVKGLMIARARRNAGLAALAKVARLSGPVSPYHLGFLIGPRINAGGRIGDAGLGSRLLASDDPVEAERIAIELDRLNKERQTLEAVMLEEADSQVFAMNPMPEVLVTASESWHPGVVGLIAARLKEKYRRPAFAIAFDKGMGPGFTGAGSGRSIGGVDLGAAVRAAVDAGLLVKGGGHAMAAGLTIEPARVEALRAFLEERLAAAVKQRRLDDKVSIDGVITVTGATTALVEQLEKAGPFGSGHPEPTFALPMARIAYADEVGQGHVRVGLGAVGDSNLLKAIAFRAASEPIGRAIFENRGRSLHIVGQLGLDHYQGDARVQLRITDVAIPQKPGLP
ncbi:MAG: single-stranded-DNA-specific exonuclease RecJ [Hyphomicrobiaceae bacterium]|nr:single-stranded-DNA-specific exonuclease RecJ [Hyphomicrobiaceae bacterium]